MTKFTLLKTTLLALTLLIGNFVWGQYSGTGTFKEITALTEIDADTYYVFYGVNSSYTGALKNTLSGGRMGNGTVSFTGSDIVNPSSDIVWKVSGNSTTGYTLYNEAVSKYCEITANTTSGFALSTSSTHTYAASLNGAKGFFFSSNSSTAGSRGISIYQSADWRPYLASAAFTLKLYKMEAASTTAAATPSITATGDQKATDNYFNTASIALSTSTDGANIYYTTNGEVPTPSSTLYSAPFNITSTTTIKAIAIKAGLDNSSVSEKTITISAPATATVPYSESFNNTLGDWINFEVAGTKPWIASANGVSANGFGGGDVKSWLISPKFTAIGAGLALSFNYASKYTGNPISVKMSTDYLGYGNPTTATWSELSSILAPKTVDNNYTVKASGNIIAGNSGTVYFALVYEANASYSDWRITNATVSNYTVPTSPTITVTEVTVPDMEAVTGLTDSEIVNVTGAALTADVSITIDGTNASMFSVSPETLSNSSGAALGSVTVTYSPTAPGTHTATLRFNTSGATEIIRTLNGTSAMATPVATDATAISTSGFTANWNAVAGATDYELSVYTKTSGASNAPSSIFSENFDGFNAGSANASANSTDVSGSLDTYTQTTGWTGSKVYQAGGTVKMGGASSLGYITTPALNLSAANLTLSFKTMAWATDATEMKIYLDDVLLYTATGLNNTDYTLTPFSASLTGGTSTSKIKFEGNLATKGRFFLEDVVISASGGTTTSTPIDGSPFTVTGTNSKTIIGLAENMTYYYKVIAKSGSTATVASNEVSVITSNSTGLHNATQYFRLRSVNGSIVLNANAGMMVEVYNSVGQRVANQMTTEGVNTIPVRAKGVVFVKIGVEVSKLIVE